MEDASLLLLMVSTLTTQASKSSRISSLRDTPRILTTRVHAGRFATRQRITLTMFHLQQLPADCNGSFHLHGTAWHAAIYHQHTHPQLLCTCTHAHVHTCKRLLLHRACPPPAAQLCRTRRSKPHQTPPTRIHWLTIVNAKKHPQHFSVT